MLCKCRVAINIRPVPSPPWCVRAGFSCSNSLNSSLLPPQINSRENHDLIHADWTCACVRPASCHSSSTRRDERTARSVPAQPNSR